MIIPNDFILQMQQILGDEYPEFERALRLPATTSVRVNSKVEASCLEVLKDAKLVPYCGTGYTLPKRPEFTLDPMLHAGAYYVQEASSMYLEAVVRKYVNGRVTALDLCAAPGGKSTHLAQLLTPDSLLVSNEIMPQRANILCENLTKWGNVNTIVTNNKPSDFGKVGSMFDLIVTDVPCSGEGMFRKEPKAVEDWSLQVVQMCAERQRSILEDVWDALKEGGLLIYSTCTFNRSEDEDNVEWIASELGAEVLEQKHFYFHNTLGEGFYIAALRKTSGSGRSAKIKDVRFEKAPMSASYIKEAGNFKFIKIGEYISAVPSADANIYAWFAANFRTLKCGTEVCAFKGKDEIPAHALAVSKIIDADKTASVNVDKATALNYLRREAIAITCDTKGYMLIKFNGIPIGWVKNLGNRANNMYPEYWRVRVKVDV
ncbi:MAG: rRNA cytosine-C5-methyltransferase [Paludibacteraceae bacterium]|nr:rRNA cytosine-C5-methyltransferase [Paludibacteraceae bacterium]